MEEKITAKELKEKGFRCEKCTSLFSETPLPDTNVFIGNGDFSRLEYNEELVTESVFLGSGFHYRVHCASCGYVNKIEIDSSHVEMHRFDSSTGEEILEQIEESVAVVDIEPVEKNWLKVFWYRFKLWLRNI